MPHWCASGAGRSRAAAPTDNGWKAAGKVTNPTDKPITYAVTVFFSTDQGIVLNTAVIVDTGKSADWAIQKDFATTLKTFCALRGVGTK